MTLRQEALDRLEAALAAEWRAKYPGARLTREARAELMRLSIPTSERLLRGQGVDRATVKLAFECVGLTLTEADLAPTEPDAAMQSEAQSIDEQRTAPTTYLAPKRRIAGWVASAVIAALALGGIAGTRTYLLESRRESIRVAYQSGLDAYHHGRLDEAEIQVERLLKLAHDFDSLEGLAIYLRLAGDIQAARGDLPKAESLYAEALRIWVHRGSVARPAELNEALGNIQLRQGRLAEAKSSFEASLKGQLVVDNPHGVAMAQRGLGSVAYQEGRYREAVSWFSAAQAELRKRPEPGMETDLRGRMALVRHRLGETEAALTELEACLRYWKAKDSRRWIALAELDLATVLRERGDHAEANRYLASSLERFEQLGDAFHADQARRAMTGTLDTALHEGQP